MINQHFRYGGFCSLLREINHFHVKYLEELLGQEQVRFERYFARLDHFLFLLYCVHEELIRYSKEYIFMINFIQRRKSYHLYRLIFVFV